MTLTEYIKTLEAKRDVKRERIRHTSFTESDLLVAEVELLNDIIKELRSVETGT